MLLNNYLEQHESIRKQITQILALIKLNDLNANASQIALEINHLAGVIKIHLTTEDKLLYPKLMEHSDESIRRLTVDYQKEMGNLMNVFTEFKTKYNTKTKIIDHPTDFIKEFDLIVQQLNKRMDKEEKGLYQNI